MPLDAEARRRGGVNRARQARLAHPVRVLPTGTLTPVTSFEDAARRADEVHRWAGEGAIDYKTADVMLKALREFRFAHAQAALARDVAALRRDVAALKQGSPPLALVTTPAGRAP